MANRNFSVAEVLDMLDDVQNEGLDHYQHELEQESDGDSPAIGDYMDEDGQQVLVDSDLLHPSVTTVLRRSNKDVLPCEMDSLLLCDAELRDEDDVSESGTSSFMEDESCFDISEHRSEFSSSSTSSESESSEPETERQGRGRGRGRRGSRGRGRARSRGQGRSRGRGQGRGRGRGQVHRPESEDRSSGQNESQDERSDRSESEQRNAEWKWSSSKLQVRNNTIAYTDNHGPKGDSLNSITPLDFFQLFLDDGMIDLFVRETNRYACQQCLENNHLSPWSDVTREEMLAFISLNIGMGIISLPSIRDYWSREPLLAHPWFGCLVKE